jgi:hypothetical protein
MKENCNIKSIHVITLTNDPISIGRGHDSDVRINDISVSRNHATLTAKLETGQLLLRDGKSKFGTLVSTSHKLCVIPGKPLYIQQGTTFMTFTLKLKLCSLLTCYKPKHLQFKNYNSFLKSVKHCKYQLKDVPNWMLTNIQMVNEREELDISSIKKVNELQRLQSNNIQNSSLLNQIASHKFINNNNNSNKQQHQQTIEKDIIPEQLNVSVDVNNENIINNCNKNVVISNIN